MMALGNVFGGAMSGGFGVNHLDIAPRGAGVIMGLSNIAISRLSQTWEKLPSKFKKLFKEFETLLVC